MEGEQTTKQLTIRIGEEMFQEIKIEADRIGSSYNSMLMVLLSLGMKVFNSQITICQKP